MAEPWGDLLIHPATAYIGVPPRGGDDVWTAPLFHSTWYIVSGGSRVERTRERWLCGPGQGIILPPGWRRHQAFAAGSVIISLGLRVVWPSGGEAVVQAAPVAIPDAAELSALARTVIAAQSGAGAVAVLRQRAALAAYAARWLETLLAAGAAVRPPGTVDPRLGRLQTELARAPRLGCIDWAGLRAATGLSRPQLDRLCQAAFGMPVRGLRDRIAVERVRELLADPARNLAGIAAAVGATDASHLVKWFRRCTGRTPGEERRLGPDA